SKMTNEEIKIKGSGRTDAGVHALGQVANFKTNSNIPIQKIPFTLNNLLPDDIRIKRAEEVDNDFHARYSATSKIYHYYIFNSDGDHFYPSFFLNKYVYYIRKNIDIFKMKKAGKLLLGENDFSSFSCSGSGIKNPIRNLIKINIKKNRKIICLQIEANAFLYKMVRGIVGTLLEVGQGKIDYSEIKRILEAKNRRESGKTVPAKGLFLMQVKY
ncbi:MAG: tRNA pseudouridine(38-40) synthase TruA, partial [Candidatus Caldatribacteriota bacterium]|nr:tRNA pseudouridine(38-40) synthase TruA [Candidatus Caldatribacteriota bacterium]